MAKRQKIDYNGEELSRNLKRSTGKGVDAFFSDPSPAPDQPTAQTDESPPQSPDTNTYARIGARMSTQAETSDDVNVADNPIDANGHRRMHARTGARMHAPTDAPENTDAGTTVDGIEDVQITAIQRMIRAKRHLSSFTFRFRANELEDLDLVMDELNQDDEYRVSKNDAVRTALNWLLADYRARKQESVLARVLMDT